MVFDASTLLLYSFVFLIPVIILVCLSIFTLTRDFYSTANRLITFISICYIVAFLGTFAAHISPLHISPYFAHFVLPVAGILSLGGLIHLVYLLVRNNTTNRILLAPSIFYAPGIGVFIAAFFFDVPEAYRIADGLWIKNELTPFLEAIYMLSGVMLLTIFLFAIKIAINIKKGIRKKMLIYMSAIIGMIIVVYFIVSFILPENIEFPYTPMYIQLFCILAIGGDMIHLELAPSMANRYRELISVSPIAIVLLDEHFNIIDMNDLARRPIEKYGIEKILKPAVFNDVSILQNGSIHDLLHKHKTLTDHIIKMNDPDKNKIYYYSVNAALLEEEHHHFYYLSFLNMTTEIQQQQQLHELAYKDQLTDLPNRAYFIPKVTAMMNSIDKGALVLLDLNFFKQINDSYGHQIGDYVLQHVAQLLKDTVEASYELARIGGDEFVIYLPYVHELDTLNFIQQLRERFETTPFIFKNITLTISPSIGYATIYPERSTHFQYYYQLADEAMYEDKRRVKQQYQF